MYHELISPDGKTGYNAKFVMGKKAVKRLEECKWYTNDDFRQIIGAEPLFLKQAQGKHPTKWRYVKYG